MAALRSLSRQPLPLTMDARLGAVLARQGERSSGAWVLERGALRESSLGHDGRELIVALLGPGQLATGPDGEMSPTTVRALRPARLRLARDPELVTLLADRDRRALELARQLAWMDVQHRLEQRLLDLAARFGRPVPGGVSINLYLPQEELAALIGASREGTSRAYRVLAERGRVRRVRRGRYVLPGQLQLLES